MSHKMRPPAKLPRMMNVPSINLYPAQSFPRFDPGVGRVFADFGGTPEDRSFQVNMPAVPEELAGNQSIDWDPRAVLSNLAFLEQKIHQVQGIVRSIVDHGGQFPVQPDELAAQQQAVNADLTSIVIQLISTAGSLLPSVKNSLLSAAPAAQLSSIIGGNGELQRGGNSELQRIEAAAEVEAGKSMDYEELLKGFSNCTGDGPGTESMQVEDHEVKESEDGTDGEHLPPGSYEILQLEKEEILAPHTHFCSICGKGFKRDANLRMHMRGHGDEYKTAAALAKPAKEASSEPVVIRRYSCPFAGCKRNKEHKKFQPLKTILCVKNHYKRSHCDKSYICSRCNCKKFSVLADLKTHEKHCGRDKWLCSCGTTFSRKDKLFGHVALFQGHTPALPLDELKAFVASDQGQASEAMSGVGNVGYSNYAGNTMENVNDLDIKGLEDDHSYYSPMNFDSCNFGGLDEFPRPVFDFPDSSFSFVPVASGDFVRKNGDGSSSGRLR